LEPVPGYRLVRFLGRGGFGEVSEARCRDNSAVALKLIELDTAAADLEQRAFTLIKELRHPHLLPVYEAWQRDGFAIFVMELAERTLLDRCREATGAGLPGIPREDLLEYMGQCAAAIDFLNHEVRGSDGNG